jgi:hypothetical protein
MEEELRSVTLVFKGFEQTALTTTQNRHANQENQLCQIMSKCSSSPTLKKPWPCLAADMCSKPKSFNCHT